MKIAEGGPPGRYVRGRYAMRIRDFCLVLTEFSGGSLALKSKYVPPYLVHMQSIYTLQSLYNLTPSTAIIYVLLPLLS